MKNPPNRSFPQLKRTIQESNRKWRLKFSLFEAWRVHIATNIDSGILGVIRLLKSVEESDCVQSSRNGLPALSGPSPTTDDYGIFIAIYRIDSK